MKTPENAPDNNVGSKTPEDGMQFFCKLRLVASETDDLLTTWRTSDLHDGLEVARDFMFEAADHIQQLESRLAQAERERDAAVADCSRFPCATCSDKENGDFCHNCNVRKDTTRTNYEWRGVCQENTKEAES